MSTMLFSSSSFKRKEELFPLFLLNITCPSITLSFISGVTLLKRITISESCGFIPPFPLLSLPAHYSMGGFLLFLSSISYATTCKKHPNVSVTTIGLLALLWYTYLRKFYIKAILTNKSCNIFVST